MDKHRNKVSTAFGELMIYHRNYVGLSLRRFAELVAYDASNISKIEKGTLPAPKDELTLKSWAKALGLSPDTSARADFIAAGLSDGICRQLGPDSDVTKLLPAFCKMVENKHSDPEAYKNLITLLRQDADSK